MKLNFSKASILCDKLLDILYPKTDPFTGKVVRVNEYKEPSDVTKLRISGSRCMRCGKPVRFEETEYCRDCAEADFSYDQGKSLFLHKGAVCDAIYGFKFHNKRIYGEYFAEEMAKEYAEQIKRWHITEMMPVPLHPKKRRKRGYNQAEILAKKLGDRLDIRVNTECIYRIENTRPQKELDDKSRRRNLRHAFAIDKEWKPSGNVLLIDDIYTTGSTIDAMARLLKKKGVKHVYFLTISIGQGN